ncbi:alpha beta-hydrolase [Coniophora puteana RWD-64-598 SS2]|uniref:Alpha beta-hydrolase n=1 Tax=Coniophora puteana (strain RWD-64-598) TaxID=741705 RepID=A0A5M3MY05_CONPW|nr:alpha beta-hydrolase [Coniophora puteana RWD-64-598 SS2]EIW83979.1 alpha beta-hydrolase [Coniophora puteana RWD-64-598 SS2]
MTETPFQILIPDQDLVRLRAKLELTTLLNEVEGAGCDYGAPISDIRRLVDKWKNGYDWRKHEAALNAELPQYTRDISRVDGFGSLNIHYVHKKSDCSGAIPLLFPGSFIEHPSFRVATFNVPGFGFSEPVLKPGFRKPQYAELGNKLMVSLGYNEYVTQGGNWGQITRQIGEMYGPKHAKAWHTNFPMFKSELERIHWFTEKGSGYSAEQRMPSNFGIFSHGQSSRPSWIYGKLHVWTDSCPWTDDEGVSIDYFSRSGSVASLCIYYEVADVGMAPAFCKRFCTIPKGASYIPKELAPVLPSWVRRENNVVFESMRESGGHFAAHEKPAELVGDLRRMFGKTGLHSVSFQEGRVNERTNNQCINELENIPEMGTSSRYLRQV